MSKKPYLYVLAAWNPPTAKMPNAILPRVWKSKRCNKNIEVDRMLNHKLEKSFILFLQLLNKAFNYISVFLR